MTTTQPPAQPPHVNQCDHAWRPHSVRHEYAIDFCGKCGAWGVYNDSGFMLFERDEDPIGQIRDQRVPGT